MGYENVGTVWTPGSLKDYLGSLTKPDWCDAITLHHTASPSLAQRPNGFIAQHLRNLEDYYKNTLGWSAGPHLFVDEDQLWGMCDFRRKGVHAVSFNKRAIGIEVLGDYDSEAPKTGRGLECWKTAAAGTKVLLDWLGLRASAKTVLFHRDDPQTSKTCPGTKVTKEWVLGLIGGSSEEPADTTHPKPPLDRALKRLKRSEWRFAGEQWCVPVRVYLGKKGLSDQMIGNMLTKKGAQFFYGDEWLEGAFYDKDSEATWAPVRELVELPIADTHHGKAKAIKKKLDKPLVPVEVASGYAIPSFATPHVGPDSGVPWKKAKLAEGMNIHSGLVRNSCHVFGGDVPAVYYAAKFAIDGDGSGANLEDDPAFQSDTSLHDATNRPLNSRRYPFIVLPLPPTESNVDRLDNHGVKLGDLGVCIYKNGAVVPVLFGDKGPRRKIGEGSMLAASQLGINPDPNVGGIDATEIPPGIVHLVFPGTNDVKSGKTSRTAEDVVRDALALFDQFRRKA